MILTNMELDGMYLFEWNPMIILCVIVSQSSQHLYIYIIIDGIYINPSVNLAIYAIHQLSMHFTYMKMCAKPLFLYHVLCYLHFLLHFNNHYI